MQLKVDTSWWTRYRSRANNPDLDPSFKFPQAIPTVRRAFPAIPRTDADLTPANHIQAIANTAAFHFAMIEQGGTSLYPTLAQKVTNSEVLLILLSIGPTEVMHFQTWQDKAGKRASSVQMEVSSFPDLNAPPFGGEDFQTNLIMPEPCPFSEPEIPSMLDHTPDDQFRRNEGNYRPHPKWAVHRPIPGIFHTVRSWQLPRMQLFAGADVGIAGAKEGGRARHGHLCCRNRKAPTCRDKRSRARCRIAMRDDKLALNLFPQSVWLL